MHLGLHYGLENTSHYKCFQPSDISDLALHFDLSDIASYWVKDARQYILLVPVSGDLSLGSSGTLVLRTFSSSMPSISTQTSAHYSNLFNKPGVFKIGKELISYDNLTSSSDATMVFTGIQRTQFDTPEGNHSTNDVIDFLISGAIVDPRCFDRVNNSIFLSTESSSNTGTQRVPVQSGGYYLSSNSNDTTNFLGIHNANKALFFDGADDVLRLNNEFTSTSLDSTYVFVVRIPQNSNANSTVSLDILIGGLVAGRAMMRLSQNNLRVRFNHDNSATNAEQILETNNTNNGTTNVQFPFDSLQVIMLLKAGNVLQLLYNNVLVAAETYTAVDSNITGALIQTLGRRTDSGGSSDSFMEFGEFLYYDKILTTPEYTELYNHLRDKWTGGL